MIFSPPKADDQLLNHFIELPVEKQSEIRSELSQTTNQALKDAIEAGTNEANRSIVSSQTVDDIKLLSRPLQKVVRSILEHRADGTFGSRRLLIEQALESVRYQHRLKQANNHTIIKAIFSRKSDK